MPTMVPRTEPAETLGGRIEPRDRPAEVDIDGVEVFARVELVKGDRVHDTGRVDHEVEPAEFAGDALEELRHTIGDREHRGLGRTPGLHRPSALIAAVIRSSSSRRRATSATRVPPAANRRATASPIPDDAPITSACLKPCPPRPPALLYLRTAHRLRSRGEEVRREMSDVRRESDVSR